MISFCELPSSLARKHINHARSIICQVRPEYCRRRKRGVIFSTHPLPVGLIQLCGSTAATVLPDRSANVRQGISLRAQHAIPAPSNVLLLCRDERWLTCLLMSRRDYCSCRLAVHQAGRSGPGCISDVRRDLIGDRHSRLRSGQDYACAGG